MTKRVPRFAAAAICRVKPDTINQWVKRGLLIRYEDGYDVLQLLEWNAVRERNKRETDAHDTPIGS